ACQTLRVIFGRHLSEHVSGSYQCTDQPFAGPAKWKFIHVHRNSGGTDRILNLTKFVAVESEGRQQVPSKKTAPANMNRGIFSTRSVRIIAMLKRTGIMQNGTRDGDLPIAFVQ